MGAKYAVEVHVTGLSKAQLTAMLAEVSAKKTAIDDVFNGLTALAAHVGIEEPTKVVAPAAAKVAETTPTGRQKLSAAARKKMSDAAKARWAKRGVKAKVAKPTATAERKPMSEATKKKLRAGAKKRWAKVAADKAAAAQPVAAAPAPAATPEAMLLSA